jgi:hypothetical protein
MYHAILVNVSFSESNFPTKFKIFAKRKTNDWLIYGVTITDKDIPIIQQNIKQKFYAHAYNNKELIIIFSNKIFHVTKDPATWTKAIKHGVYHGIPKEQLDFIPNKFEDEEDYFSK